MVNVNIIPYIILFVMVSLTIYRFRDKLYNIKRVKSDKIECRIIQEGQKPRVLKVNKSHKFFNNTNKEDKTKYTINIDKSYINKKNILTIDYRYGVTEPINFNPSSKLMIISKDIKNAIESKIIQDLRASITDKLFTTMDVKMTIILIASIVTLIGLLFFISLFYQFKEELTPIIIFFNENKEVLLNVQ